jgi:hypothetical protein
VPVPDCGATTAVKLTDWPTVEGLTLGVSARVVGVPVVVVKLRIEPTADPTELVATVR